LNLSVRFEVTNFVGTKVAENVRERELRAFLLLFDVEETREVRLFLAKIRVLPSCFVSTGSENALSCRGDTENLEKHFH